MQNLTEESLDSQNYNLRVSDSFMVDDTQEVIKSEENFIARRRDIDNIEVIVISDSSDEDNPVNREWNEQDKKEFKRRTRENGSLSLSSEQSSECGKNVRMGRGTYKSRRDEKSLRKGLKACSIAYTSDETVSDLESRESGNKENFENDALAGKSIIPESDDSIFSFDQMRGVLAENECNVRTQGAPRCLPSKDNVVKPETNFKTEKIIDTRYNTGSLNNLKKNMKKLEVKTPEILRIDRNGVVNSNILKDSNKRSVVSKTSQPAALAKSEDACPKSREKERREKALESQEAQKTPQFVKTWKKDGKLSKKDLRSIMKILESQKAVYQSPQVAPNVEESSESEGETEKSSRKAHPAVIEETESESEENIIRGSRVDLSKPYKTHVTRFLEPTINSPDLSETKKLEIARWLMTNSVDRVSESSVSNVSPSNRNSSSSGNSSLERLEMNYETPNNREKMRKLRPGEKRVEGRTVESAKSVKSTGKSTKSAKSTKSTNLRQITMDEFFKKKEDDSKMLTPVTPVRKETTERLDFEDCVDILDDLYGNTWRARAKDLLPATEPKKKPIALCNKAVQTERKINPRKKKVQSSDSTCSEDFTMFVKNIKPNLNSTEKPKKRSDPHRCSFINDSSTGSDTEGTYLTALTNPQIFENRKKNKSPTQLPLTMQRAIAICDSDTDDEKVRDTKKKLFADEESDSSTSEYDPNDYIPAKSKEKFTTTKSTKIRVPTVNNKHTRTRNTFLSSLSSTIPLNEAHPEARKYRENFKNTKEELCKYLFKLFNEKIFDNKLPSDMSIEWNVRMRGTAGFCYNKRSLKALGSVKRSSRIVLATKILDTPDRLRDTLVHELCHAAAWLLNEVSDGHGPYWKAWTTKAMKAFPELPAIKRCHDYKIMTKFTYRCTGCGYSINRHSKSLDTEKKRCGHCYGKFELLVNKLTKSGKVESKTPSGKNPTGFALFVKENYSSVKKEKKGLAHKEVMQMLGQQFSAIKVTKNNDNGDTN